MKTIMIHIILSFTVLIFGGVPCSADSQTPEEYLLQQMNQVRKTPYETAVSLGYSPEYLRERNIFPETVLPEMTADASLQKRAAADLANDVSMGWNNHNSPEFSENGNSQAVLTDLLYVNAVNRSAVISFLNYMPLERACRIFISHILREELDSGQKKGLLSHKITHAGVFVSSGLTAQGNNAWFFSFHLGGGPFLQEMQLLNLINQVRAWPQAASAFMRREFFSAMKKKIRVKTLLQASYNPVFFNSGLYNFLKTDQDIYSLNEEYPGFCFSKYDFAYLSETSPWETSDQIVSVSQVFAELMENEFIGKPKPCERLIFSNQFSSFTPKMKFSGNHGNIQGMMVGAKEISDLKALDSKYFDMIRLYILAFSDSNENSLYNPGEEYAGLHFKVFDAQKHLLQSFETDRAGHADVQLSPFQTYIFRIEYTPNHIIEREVFLMKDQFLSFMLPGFRNAADLLAK